MDEFVRFFNRFSDQKQLSYFLNADSLRMLAPAYRITKAKLHDETLFSHLYLCDREKSRVTILYGASILKDEKRGISNAVLGSANRALHYYDMCLFRKEGYRVYDFGGYAPDTADSELKKINDFKDDFGGRLVCETNYRSVLLAWTSTALNSAVKWKQRRRVRRATSMAASRTG
jgi:hypothetical protein